MRYICRIMVTGSKAKDERLLLRAIIAQWVKQYAPSLQWWPHKLWRNHL